MTGEHPSIEELFIQEAVKHLTPKQRTIWEYDRLDHLTQDEIANKLHIAQPVVSRHLQAIEKRLLKWMKANRSLYKTLKANLPNIDDGEIKADDGEWQLRDNQAKTPVRDTNMEWGRE